MKAQVSSTPWPPRWMQCPAWHVLFLLLVLPMSIAQQQSQPVINATDTTYDTLCQDSAIIASCARQHRECTLDSKNSINNTNTNDTAKDQPETCGPCVFGFVEFRTDAFTRSNASLEVGWTNEQQVAQGIPPVVCFPIRNITMDLFQQRFDPIWVVEEPRMENSSSANVPTLQDRLEWLLAMAALIERHNRQQPPPAYELGLNALSADSPMERTRRLGYQPRSDGKTVADLLEEAEFIQDDYDHDDNRRRVQLNLELPPLAPSIDWHTRGAVTSVKDQGVCGCCWSIAVAGAIEGAAAIHSNFTYLQSVSFQQMISCENTFSLGCNGGYTATGLLYSVVNEFGGMARLNDYSFRDGRSGQTTTTCETAGHPVAVTVGKPRYVVSYAGHDSSGDDFETRVDKMKRGLQRGPMSVAMAAECDTISQYRRGVLTDDGDCVCGPIVPCLNHAVLMVGYNDAPDNGDPPYWLLKNSWGVDWGEDGYFRVSQHNPLGENNPNSWGLFGILAEGTMPLQAYNQTEQVYDEPQRVGLSVGGIVGVAIACCVVALVAGGALFWIQKKKQRQSEGDQAGEGYHVAAGP